MKVITKNILNLLYLTIFISMVSSCSDSDSPSSQDSNATAEWKTSSSVGSDEVSTGILLKGDAGTQYSATISQGASFSSFDYNTSKSAKLGVLKEGDNVIYIYCKANATADPRNVVINITFGDAAPQQLTLVQKSVSQEILPVFSAWPELPAEKVSTDYQYATHYVTVNGKKIRSYSLCFDKNNKAALWVAYPMHAVYDGSVGRSDEWGFDPYITQTNQANCVSRSYGGNYDRGHQIPSADRDATFEMNAQTFYMSNMTPQLDRLNQDMWAKLETKVRNNICSDTLYVVTGAYFGAGATTTTDGAGNIVAIPTNYFKILLRTKSGNSGKSIALCSDSELISIGFWVDHKAYGNIEPPTTICTSVADIEAKTGFSFFPGVSAAVKSQNTPSVWGVQ